MSAIATRKWCSFAAALYGIQCSVAAALYGIQYSVAAALYGIQCSVAAALYGIQCSVAAALYGIQLYNVQLLLPYMMFCPPLLKIVFVHTKLFLCHFQSPTPLLLRFLTT